MVNSSAQHVMNRLKVSPGWAKLTFMMFILVNTIWVCFLGLKAHHQPEKWSAVWARKGLHGTKPNSIQDLIKIDGFDHADNYLKVMESYANWIGTGTSGSVLCDIGCGAGAFVRILPPDVGLVLCVDLNADLLRTSAAYDSRLPTVHFPSNADDLWGIPDGFCDSTLSMSVLQYMDSETQMEKTAQEAMRITKPGGQTFFFDVRDGDKVQYAAHRAAAGLAQSNHYFIPKTYWTKYPNVLVRDLHELVGERAEEYYYNANFSYSVRVTKSAK